MNLSATEIVTSFETLGMSVEQIADDTGFDPSAIKAILLQSSSMYRKDAKKDDSLQFTEDEASECKKIIFDLARHSEDEYMQFKAARYVLDSKTGRLDIGKNLQQINFNAIDFNIQMTKAMKAARATEEHAAAQITNKQDFLKHENNRSKSLELVGVE